MCNQSESVVGGTLSENNASLVQAEAAALQTNEHISKNVFHFIDKKKGSETKKAMKYENIFESENVFCNTFWMSCFGMLEC